MKVTHTNYFKPAPFIGAAVQGLFNLGGATVDAAIQRELARMQMEHDHEMAGVNYNYSINQMNHSSHLQKGIMDKQQQQAIELMDYQNEYNDPSAVRQRYQAAGISPQAAFGSGAAGGAGIAGSFSMPSGSAPSGGSTGHSSNIMYRTNFAGIGSGMAQAINDAHRIQAQNQKDQAEAQKAYEQAKSVALDNEQKEWMKENGAWQTKLKNEKAIATANDANAAMASYRSARYDFEHSLDMSKKSAEVQQMFASIDKYRAEIDRIEELTPAEKENLLASADVKRKEAERLATKIAWESLMRGAPLELMNTTTGVANFLSKSIGIELPNDVGNAIKTAAGRLKVLAGRVSLPDIEVPPRLKEFANKYYDRIKNNLKQ